MASHARFALVPLLTLVGCAASNPSAGDGSADDSTGGSSAASGDGNVPTSSDDASPDTGGGPEGSSGGAGSSTDGEGTTAGDSTGAPSCVLDESGPITVTADGQVIERLHIVASDGPGIVVEGFTNVIIRDVWIEHAGSAGIELSSADDTTLDHVVIDHTGAPASGENPSDELLNLSCYDSARLSMTDVRASRGSSGAYLLECPDASISRFEGHDFRGPFPRGQLVQLDKSDGAVIEDFSVVNPPGSWPEDNVNVYQSIDVEIRRGLIDGNNSPSGVGVIFDGDNGLGVVEDVDAIRMGNGCFSDYAGSDGVVFRRTRCRENICEDQGRGVPLSNALMWAGSEAFTMLRIEDSHYFASCNDNLVWPEESFAVIELEEQDFALRDPIAVAPCWE
jgi:hypothetical protein